MSKNTDICILETESKTEYFPYRSPAKFGGRIVNDVTLLNVSVRVRTRDGKEAVGYGSMSMGNIWAWPSKTLSTDQTLRAMVEFGHKVTAAGKNPGEYGHPLELVYDFSKEYQHLADVVSITGITAAQSAEPMVKLAQLVAASPFEAAVFDAYGRVLGANSYNVLSKEYCNRDLAYYLGSEFTGEYLDQYVLAKPKERMPIYHLVGALDPLDDTDTDKPLNDGLPEHLAQWIPYNGLTHLKIKLNGDDLAWDVNRVLRVDRIAEKLIAQPVYSADFNEKCENVEYVLEFLRQIGEKAPKAIERLQYIEQPTNRNLRAYPENKMHKAAAIKPVVIDEALVDFDSLLYSREMGYSGVALKACKGHAEALLMGAAAQKYKMFLCVQDLTCPGASFLHSATLSARIPGVQAIEGNGRQYCPSANAAWEPLYPSMFKITDGTLGTSVFDEAGLGF
ncbi:MAG: hypothetical protein LBT46_09610, partial [Planctomycetaceae bacterium]|nr:hypothetical protein [Planctomycetaceae bacterium]